MQELSRVISEVQICRLNVLSSTYWVAQTNSPILVGEDYARVDALVVDAFVVSLKADTSLANFTGHIMC
jgi:hypothetical protein